MARTAIERATDPDTTAIAWFLVDIASATTGNHEDATTALEHANVAAATTDEWVHFWILYGASVLALYAGPEALPAATARLATHADHCGAPWMLAIADLSRGSLALEHGDYRDALESFRSGLTVSTSVRSLSNAGMCAGGIVTSVLAGAETEPTAEVSEMLAIIRDTRNWSQLSVACEPVANYFARHDNLDAAAVIAGVLQRTAPYGSYGARMRTETLELIATVPNVDTLLARGAAMSPAEAIDFVIEHVDRSIDNHQG